MKNRLVFGLFIGLFLISFVSAYNGGGFSIGELFDDFGGENLLLLSVFFVMFAFLNFILLKVLKDNYGEPSRKTAGMIAFLVSLIIVYGFYKLNFDIEKLLFTIGLDENVIYTLIPIIILAFMGYLIWKIGFHWAIIVTGALFIAIALFTDLIYESGALAVLGIVLVILGIIIWRYMRKKNITSRSEYVKAIFAAIFGFLGYLIGELIGLIVAIVLLIIIWYLSREKEPAIPKQPGAGKGRWQQRQMVKRKKRWDDAKETADRQRKWKRKERETLEKEKALREKGMEAEKEGKRIQRKKTSSS